MFTPSSIMPLRDARRSRTIRAMRARELVPVQVVVDELSHQAPGFRPRCADRRTGRRRACMQRQAGQSYCRHLAGRPPASRASRTGTALDQRRWYSRRRHSIGRPRVPRFAHQTSRSAVARVRCQREPGSKRAQLRRPVGAARRPAHAQRVRLVVGDPQPLVRVVAVEQLQQQLVQVERREQARPASRAVPPRPSRRLAGS